MMWCNTCKKPVEPSSHNEYEIPNIDLGGYERVQVLTCPDCGQEVYQEPELCVMCKEFIAPGKALCDLCNEDISASVDLLAEYKKVDRNAVKDGLAEYLNMEDR